MNKNLLILLVLVLYSCSSQENDKVTIIEKEIFVEDTRGLWSPFRKLKNKISYPKYTANKIVIDNATKYNNSNIIEISEIDDNKIVHNYQNLISKHYNRKYCCCSEWDLNLTFWDDTSSIETFWVDTASYNDRVIISPHNYNNCLILEKEKWLELIENTK